MTLSEGVTRFSRTFVDGIAIVSAALVAVYAVVTVSSLMAKPENTTTPAGLDAEMRRLLERVDIGQDRLEAAIDERCGVKSKGTN